MGNVAKNIIMQANDILKYKHLSTPRLKSKAIEVFNKWIRERDKERPCVSCGSWNTEHASHYYSSGKHTNLRFNEDNVHLSCLKCNYFLHGNLIPYRQELIKRIGIERVEALDNLAKIRTTKQDRFLYIEIITKYKL